MVKSACVAGQYGDCTYLDDALDTYSCELDTCYDWYEPCPVSISVPEFDSLIVLCYLLCFSPAGTYSKTVGALSLSECSSCPKGYFNNQTRATSCSQLCPSGSYVTDNTKEDSDGVGVSTGGLFCLPCPSGRITSAAGASSCTACPAGTAANSSRKGCDSCARGKYAASSASAHCTASLAGFCVPGRRSTAQTRCVSPLTSYAGSANCTKCIENYYIHEGQCHSCPDHTTCEEGTTLGDISVESGFWRSACHCARWLLNAL